MSARVNVRMSKIMRTLIEVGVCTHATYANCRTLANNRINKLHERALRFEYDDYETSFSVLLAKDGSFTIHHPSYKYSNIHT